MSRRRSAKTRSGSKDSAVGSPLSRQPEILEFRKLLGDIRVNLSRLSRTYGEPMRLRFHQDHANHRSYRSPARVEAEALYHMVQVGGDTVDNVRELIAVPPKLEEYVTDPSFPNRADQRRLLASLGTKRGRQIKSRQVLLLPVVHALFKTFAPCFFWCP